MHVILMQISTRSQQLHLTGFCEMNAFSEKEKFIPLRGKIGHLEPY